MLQPSRRVALLQMDADLCAPTASDSIEVHRACGDDVGSGKRPPREDLVLDLVDDLGVPFDGQAGGTEVTQCDVPSGASVTLARCVMNCGRFARRRQNR